MKKVVRITDFLQQSGGSGKLNKPQNKTDFASFLIVKTASNSCIQNRLDWAGMSMNGKAFRGIAVTTTILSYLSGSTIVGILIGRWVDQYFQTSPLFLIIGLLIGLAAGVYGMIYLVNQLMGDNHRE